MNGCGIGLEVIMGRVVWVLEFCMGMLVCMEREKVEVVSKETLSSANSISNFTLLFLTKSSLYS